MDWDTNRGNEDLMVMDQKQVKKITDSVLDKIGRTKQENPKVPIPLLSQNKQPVQFPMANKKSKKNRR